MLKFKFSYTTFGLLYLRFVLCTQSTFLLLLPAIVTMTILILICLFIVFINCIYITYKITYYFLLKNLRVYVRIGCILDIDTFFVLFEWESYTVWLNYHRIKRLFKRLKHWNYIGSIMCIRYLPIMPIRLLLLYQ